MPEEPVVVVAEEAVTVFVEVEAEEGEKTSTLAAGEVKISSPMEDEEDESRWRPEEEEDGEDVRPEVDRAGPVSRAGAEADRVTAEAEEEPFWERRPVGVDELVGGTEAVAERAEAAESV